MLRFARNDSSGNQESRLWAAFAINYFSNGLRTVAMVWLSAHTRTAATSSDSRACSPPGRQPVPVDVMGHLDCAVAHELPQPLRFGLPLNAPGREEMPEGMWAVFGSPSRHDTGRPLQRPKHNRRRRGQVGSVATREYKVVLPEGGGDRPISIPAVYSSRSEAAVLYGKCLLWAGHNPRQSAATPRQCNAQVNCLPAQPAHFRSRR
jgi:hypothetical protein